MKQFSRPVRAGLRLTTRFFVLALVMGSGMAQHLAIGQTLQLSPSAIDPTIVHTFTPGMYGSGNMNRDRQNFTFPTPSINLSDYNKIVMEVHAPLGYAWSVHFDPAFANPLIKFETMYSYYFAAPWDTVTSAELKLTLADGASTAIAMSTTWELMPESGEKFDLYGSFTPSRDITFTGFTLTIDYDNSRLSTSPLEHFYTSSLIYTYNNGANSDPGGQLRLVAVPEPSMLGIGLIGTLVMAWRREVRPDRMRGR